MSDSETVKEKLDELTFTCSRPVVDTHAESALTLRLDRPFQALVAYARNLDMESMDSMEHSHIPYAVLLVRALERFKVGNSQQILLYVSYHFVHHRQRDMPK